MKTVKNLQICPLQIFVRPEFALNFCYTYFNWIFHPQGVTFWQFFAVRAHIRIFLAFIICINFYSILKIEPARPHLPPKNLGASSGQEIVYIGNFLWIKTWPLWCLRCWEHILEHDIELRYWFPGTFYDTRGLRIGRWLPSQSNIIVSFEGSFTHQALKSMHFQLKNGVYAKGHISYKNARNLMVK